MAIDYVEAFAPAVGDWFAIYEWPEAPAGADPWVCEPIIGWALVESEDDDSPHHTVRAIRPVIGGDVITLDGDGWLGVYRRIDLQQPHIRRQLFAKCGRIETQIGG